MDTKNTQFGKPVLRRAWAHTWGSTSERLVALVFPAILGVQPLLADIAANGRVGAIERFFGSWERIVVAAVLSLLALGVVVGINCARALADQRDEIASKLRARTAAEVAVRRLRAIRIDGRAYPQRIVEMDMVDLVFRVGSRLHGWIGEHDFQNLLQPAGAITDFGVSLIVARQCLQHLNDLELLERSDRDYTDTGHGRDFMHLENAPEKAYRWNALGRDVFEAIANEVRPHV